MGASMPHFFFVFYLPHGCWQEFTFKLWQIIGGFLFLIPAGPWTTHPFFFGAPHPSPPHNPKNEPTRTKGIHKGPLGRVQPPPRRTQQQPRPDLAPPAPPPSQPPPPPHPPPQDRTPPGPAEPPPPPAPPPPPPPRPTEETELRSDSQQAKNPDPANHETQEGCPLSSKRQGSFHAQNRRRGAG